MLLKNFSNLHKKSIQRATTSLHDAGLIHKITLPITIYPEPGQIRGYKFKYSLVRLNRHGRGLCRRLATQDSRWKPRETQWERMRRVHEGKKHEPNHTLACLVFAYQVRLRGYGAGVMPNYQVGRFVPDVLIQKNGKELYVEVELGTGKQAKWKNMVNALDYIAYCGHRPEHTIELLAECSEAIMGTKAAPVYSANLSGLIHDKAKEPLPWLEKSFPL